MEHSGQDRPSLRKGIYRHFKGGLYQVLGLVCHSETEEWLVLYQPSNDSGVLWVRPYSHFMAVVEKPGYIGPRFAHLKD